ncbi:MAG: Gfo/Idh/MocA family oxidoreductase [Bacteroidales bacterium]|nr:Gfo/Idh/MocA family oxidoreductase [Bacteroidales bacterium]
MNRIKIYFTSLFVLFVLASFQNIEAETASSTIASGTRHFKAVINTGVPPRARGQKDVLQLRCAPLPVVRVGFIGLGMRGQGAVYRFTRIDGVEIKALCDLEAYNIKSVQSELAQQNRPLPDEYLGEEAWKKVCERDDIDLIYICTHWALHTPIAVYAMKHGKHVAIEVPAACTLSECWQLVNTAEKTQRHCMMLENCCYDFFEMATLNMAQQGLFGEIVHVEGAYIHDLRDLNFNDRLKKDNEGNTFIDPNTHLPQLTGYWNHWRLKENTEHDGNLYPTHGLGPVCQALNIHRGDRMDYLVSLSSNQFNMTAYAKEQFGDTSIQAQTDYKKGDMNITLIKTVKGKSIMIQHDVSSPRTYSRIHLISGTRGYAQKYPEQALAFSPRTHSPMLKEQMDSVLKVYEHPIAIEIGEKAKAVGGHGGMDFIMDYRLVYCLQHGLPLDQDVYDAAEWCSIIELSRMSVNNHSTPVQVPDFTRGAWDKIKGLNWAK